MTVLGPLLLSSTTNDGARHKAEMRWAYIHFDANNAISEVRMISPQDVNERFNGVLPRFDELTSSGNLPEECLVLAPQPTHKQMYYLTNSADTKLERYDFALMNAQEGNHLTLNNLRALPTKQQFDPSHNAWMNPIRVRAPKDCTKAYLSFYNTIYELNYSLDSQYKMQQEKIKEEAEQKSQEASAWLDVREQIDLDKLEQIVDPKLGSRPRLSVVQKACVMSGQGFYYNWQTLKSASESKEAYCQHLRDILGGHVDLNDINKNNAAMLRPYFYPTEIDKLKNFYDSDERPGKPSIGDVYDWQCQLLIAEYNQYASGKEAPQILKISDITRRQPVGNLNIDHVRQNLAPNAIAIFQLYQQYDNAQVRGAIPWRDYSTIIKSLQGILQSEERYWQDKSDLELLFFTAGADSFDISFQNFFQNLIETNTAFHLNNIFISQSSLRLSRFIEEIDSFDRLLALFKCSQSKNQIKIISELHKQNKFSALVKSDEQRNKILDFIALELINDLAAITSISHSVQSTPKDVLLYLIFNIEQDISSVKLLHHVDTFEKLLVLLMYCDTEKKLEIIDELVRTECINDLVKSDKERVEFLKIFNEQDNKISNHLASICNVDSHAILAFNAYNDSDYFEFKKVLINIPEEKYLQVSNDFKLLLKVKEIDPVELKDASFILRKKNIEMQVDEVFELEDKVLFDKLIQSIDSVGELIYLLFCTRNRSQAGVIKALREENKFSILINTQEDKNKIINVVNQYEYQSVKEIELALNLNKNAINAFIVLVRNKHDDFLNYIDKPEEYETSLLHILNETDGDAKSLFLTLVDQDEEVPEHDIMQVLKRCYDVMVHQRLLTEVNALDKDGVRLYIKKADSIEKISAVCHYSFLSQNNGEEEFSSDIFRLIMANKSSGGLLEKAEQFFDLLKKLPDDSLQPLFDLVGQEIFFKLSSGDYSTLIKLATEYLENDKIKSHDHSTKMASTLFTCLQGSLAYSISSGQELIAAINNTSSEFLFVKENILKNIPKDNISKIMFDPLFEEAVKKLNVKNFDATQSSLDKAICEKIYSYFTLVQLFQYVCNKDVFDTSFFNFPERLNNLSVEKLQLFLGSDLFREKCSEKPSILNGANVETLLLLLDESKRELFFGHELVKGKIPSLMKIEYFTKLSEDKLEEVLKNSDTLKECFKQCINSMINNNAEALAARAPYQSPYLQRTDLAQARRVRSNIALLSNNFPWDIEKEKQKVIFKYISLVVIKDKIRTVSQLNSLLDILDDESRKELIRELMNDRLLLKTGMFKEDPLAISEMLKNMSSTYKVILLDVLIEDNVLDKFMRKSVNDISRLLEVINEPELAARFFLHALELKRPHRHNTAFINTLDDLILMLKSCENINHFESYLKVISDDRFENILQVPLVDISKVSSMLNPQQAKAFLGRLSENKLLLKFFSDKDVTLNAFREIPKEELFKLLTALPHTTLNRIASQLVKTSILINTSNISGTKVLGSAVSSLNDLINLLPIRIDASKVNSIHELQQQLLLEYKEAQDSPRKLDTIGYGLWMASIFQAKTTLQQAGDRGLQLLQTLETHERESKSVWPIHSDKKAKFEALISEVNQLPDNIIGDELFSHVLPESTLHQLIVSELDADDTSQQIKTNK